MATQSKIQGTGIILGFLLASFVAEFSTGALADPPPIYPATGNSISTPAGDPQARVGRISLIDGTVSFHTPDQDQWSYATLNYPVVGGNSFWTEPGARAEIQAGSTALRLDGGTETNIDELDDHGLRAEVSQGTVNLHVGAMAAGEAYQITTPHGVINVLQSGTYRITTGENVPDEVAVLRGAAQVTQAGDPGDTLTVAAGETASIPPDKPSSVSMQATVPTVFDNWSLTRDNYEEPRQTAHYVSPEMTGYEDLDNYGIWSTEPGYGAVWVPSAVPVGWVPYHYGHWVWVSPWGWTWIDEAPWGFAPFHYGRWAYFHNHWGWTPGVIATRPVYAPALVAFVGGNGWSVSLGIGEQPVGWFPLGPGEVYHPGYHVSRDYVRHVNITNVRNVTDITHVTTVQTANASFANRRFATVVSAKDFSASRPVDKAALHVSADRLAAAPVAATSAPPVAHDRHFISGTRAPAPPVAPHAPTVVNSVTEKPAAETRSNAPDHAPGPPIRHRDTTAGASWNRATSVPSPAVVQRNMVASPASIQTRPVANIRQTTARPAPREISVQHPVQTAPLTPSHEGWVRRQPTAAPAASTPRTEPHNEQSHGGEHSDQRGQVPNH